MVETAPASNAAELTVSELSSALKRTVEDRFGYVRVRGEISGYRGPHSSGHVYFCLKDQGAKIDAVMWKGVFARLRVRPEEGMEVIATGKVTTYPGKSSYQIVIETIEPAGVGALMALLEERRRKLATEGLFDAARKQLLPFLPRIIGVVTSPTGAVIRDILHRIADRFPLHVIVWPVRVQGETSAAEVAAAIAGFNAMEHGGAILRPDVIIVARGGGSLEDLWGFNEEIVVRAAAESLLPLVSAVGHETDWTLIDHAADVRAPTPTAAAELCTPVRADLLTQIGDRSRRHAAAMARFLDRRRADLRSVSRALPTADSLLGVPTQRLDRAGEKLRASLEAGFRARHIHIERASRRLAAQSPHARMARAAQRLEQLSIRLDHALSLAAQQRRHRLDRTGEKLRACSDTGLKAGNIRLERASQRFAAQSPHASITRAAQRLEQLSIRLDRARSLAAQQHRHRLDALAGRLGTAFAGSMQIARQRQSHDCGRLASLRVRMGVALTTVQHRREARLASFAQLLGTLGYRNVLARGFALVRDEHGKPLHTAAAVQPGARLDIEFADGHVPATALPRPGADAPPKPRAERPSRANPVRSQGSLF
jgi:exodeoxyribonuclease VII large subunit